MKVEYHLPEDTAEAIDDHYNHPAAAEVMRTYRDLAGVTIDAVVEGKVGESLTVGADLLGLDSRRDPDELEDMLNGRVKADGGNAPDGLEPVDYDLNGSFEVTDT